MTPLGPDLQEIKVWGSFTRLGAAHAQKSHHQLLSAQLARLHERPTQTTGEATYSFAIIKKEKHLLTSIPTSDPYSHLNLAL
jgi:hypothetical protein